MTKGDFFIIIQNRTEAKLKNAEKEMKSPLLSARKAGNVTIISHIVSKSFSIGTKICGKLWEMKK